MPQRLSFSYNKTNKEKKRTFVVRDYELVLGPQVAELSDDTEYNS